VKFAIETLPIVLNKHKLSSQSLWMIVLKIVGTILSFYLVPLSINIIGKDNYGYWIVISSFFAWFGFLDFGIGNGLKNRIAEKDQTLHQEQIKHYVSTSYTITVIISIAVILVGVIMSFFVDWWDLLFGNQNNSINNFQGVFLLSFIFTIFILPLKLILSIQHGLQNNLKSSFVNFYQILIVFVFFNIIDHLGSISFGLYVLLSAIIPLLVLTGVNLFEFSSKLNFIRPKLTYFRFDYLKSLFPSQGNFE
jgi:O-antigen/teichoic acid export membrane protein